MNRGMKDGKTLCLEPSGILALSLPKYLPVSGSRYLPVNMPPPSGVQGRSAMS